MFVVLGTIIVVTLLGFVGLTLAGKDQSQSGDFADLKSTDQVGMAGLQLAINRLTANPANMVTQLNAFITDSRAHSSSIRSWLNLTGANVAVATANPGWDPLSTTAGDLSAVEVQILAVASGPDTAAVPSQDSEAIYIALQCSARGRHGDLRTVQGTYLIHGVSLAFTQVASTVVIPAYAFYVGGSLTNSNLQASITGGVYVGGTGSSYINSNPMAIHGTFKWNGDLKVNASLSVDSSAFIAGGLYVNSTASPLTVGGNLGVTNGFQTINGPISVTGNMWVGGTGTNTTWNSGANLTVGGNLVLWPSGNFSMGGGTNLKVGGNAWLMSGLTKSYNAGDSVRTLGNLYLTDSSTTVGFAFSQQNSGGFYVKQNLVSNTKVAQTLTFNNAPGRVSDSMYISNNGTLSLNSVLTVDLSNHAYFSHLSTSGSGKVTVQGTNYTNGQSYTTGSHANYVKAPIADSLGLNAAIQKTDTANNAMDSVVLTSTVAAHMITLTSTLLSQAGVGANTTFSPSTMSRLFRYLDSTGQTYDGYMILDLTSATTITTFSDSAAGGFVGKAMYVVDASYNINGNWPHSQDSTDIQILDIRGTSGALESWGWKYGNFSGIFYWQDPACGGHTLQLPSSGTWTGAFLMGMNPTCAVTMQPNSSSISLVLSQYVFTDIGKNLPNVIKAGVHSTNGTTNSSTAAVMTTTTSPFLRQVTDKPFFETVGVYR